MTLFVKPPSIDGSPMKPRPYQVEALEALDEHLRVKSTHPCVVIPTGGGKSILMAWAIAQWKREYPPFRCCILAHRKELIRQNSNEMLGVWPGGDIGVYAAGLGKRDTEASVTFAAIDSIYRRWGEFESFDAIIVDEAHRIPARGEGKYRSFIEGCRSINGRLRVIGFTATPFRMTTGPICHRDHILNEVCYEANIGDLINDGYLCQLRSKVGDVQPEIDNVRRNSGGDYVVKSLGEAVDTPSVVTEAVRSAMGVANREELKSMLFFCVNVKHAKDVSTELLKYNVIAPVVTGKTSKRRRDEIAEKFTNGMYRAICNVNVYTEGFNVQRVDGIVLLRPTLSPGLYVQMVGRGLRLHPSKTACIVLDYARCIETHGPIDCIEEGEVRLATCEECGDTFSWAIRKCPNCGWEIPKQEVERVEAEERERQLHEARASNRDILGGSRPETLEVDEVAVHRHRKPGKPDSIRVQYRCGMRSFSEWVCLDHGGYAERKARRWWGRRFGLGEAVLIDVDSALDDLFTPQRIAACTESITVKRNGKHFEILHHSINKERPAS